jgi:hypothetical protein
MVLTQAISTVGTSFDKKKATEANTAAAIHCLEVRPPQDGGGLPVSADVLMGACPQLGRVRKRRVDAAPCDLPLRNGGFSGFSVCALIETNGQPVMMRVFGNIFK